MILSAILLYLLIGAAAVAAISEYELQEKQYYKPSWTSATLTVLVSALGWPGLIIHALVKENRK